MGFMFINVEILLEPFYGVFDPEEQKYTLNRACGVCMHQPYYVVARSMICHMI